MLQLHLLVLCMVGIVLADSTQPDLSQSLFTWSCSSDSIIPCDVSMAVCHSSTGIPGCRTGTYTYPTLVCLSIPAGIPVEEKLCNPFHRPAPAPCTESSSCVARCRATADDFLDSCDHPSTWKCNDVDAQQCGWSCSSASRDVYCSDGSVAVDINMCENLPSTTGSDVPYGTCDPFLAPSTAVTIAHLNSGNGISVEWTSFASDVEYVVEVSFNSAAASLVSRPYCSVPASESGPSLSTECMLSFLPSGDARLRIKMNGDAASRTRVLVSFTPTLPCSPSGASAVASVMLPHRTIGVSAPIEFTNGEHVPFPDAGSTSANHAFHLETYNTVTGVSRGWLIGDYSRPDGSNLFGKTVILKSFIVSFDESVSMSKEDTKCGIVIGTSLATSMSDAVDINFVSVFYPDNHKVRLEPSSQITVPAGTKSIGIVCSAITALKLGSFPVKVEMFSATTSYGMGQGLMTVARSPSPNTVSIFGPEEQNPKGIFLKHSISAVYTKGVAYSSPSAPAQSVHQYILNSESAAFVRASHRSYAAKRAHLDPNGALWGSQMTIGLAGEPACVIASGDGLPVPCGVVCGAVTRVCAAHGLVQPLEMCVSPVWPAAESACEGTAVAPTSVQLRLGGGELQITAEALEIHVPTIVTVKLADTFNIYLDHLLLCSQAPLSMTRWCRVSGPVASVSMLLPPASGTFTRTGSLSLDSGYPTFACTGSSASVSMSLPTSNGRTISRLPATPTALALNCAAGEAVAAPVVGRPSVAAFAPTSTVGSKGSLFLAFTVDKSALSTQVIRDRIGAISSVTLSGISSISDLSGCTRVRSYTGFDAFDPFWFVKPNGFSTSAVSEQITSETATMSAELDINIYQGKGSLTVGLVFEGVGISSTKDTLISPVLTLKNSNGMSFNLGSTSFEVALSVSPHPEVTISGDLAVVVATIPAAEGRIIDGPKLSHALGINDVEYASWQTGSDGGFVFSVTVPTSDMWIAAAAVAPSVMNKVLHTSAAVQHGVIVPSAPCKVDIFAPDTYTCLSSETFVAAPCPPRPTSCDAADFGYSLACGTAISAQDPRFQACRSATLPEAFDFCKNTMDIGGVAISEGEGDSRGIVLASYALSKGGSIANLRPLFLILGGMEHLGPIASCTIASESKPIACGIDSDGKLRIAVSHGLRELASAPITIKPKMRSYLSHAAAVSVSAYNSKGELAFMFTETATVASRIPQAQDPETKATGGISVAGDGSVTAWVHATTTASDFNPPGSLLKMAVLRVSDFSRFETATKCISVVGTASMTNSSPWPASNMFVSNVKSGELYFQKDANANSMGGSVFIPLPENVAPFTSVYIACTGLKMSPTSFTVHGMLFSSASNDENKIEGGISLTPPNGLFTNLFNPSSPAPDDTEIRIKFEISPATAILSAEARNTIAASIIGFTDDYIGARVQSTPGSVVVLVGVSGVFPSLETAFMGDGIAVPSAITSAIQAGFAADGDNTVTVTPSAGIELGYGFIWRCFSPSGSADVCQISNRCGSALKYARACAAVQANGSIVAATNEADCAHLPAPWTRDVSGCGTAFSAPSVRRAGGTTVAVSFDVDLVHVPDSPSLTVAISVPDTVSRGLVCTTSSTSAVIDDCRASANGNMIVRISDASFTQDSAESVVNGWNYYPFTVYFHNVDLSAWSMKAPTVSSVTVSMPSRLQSNVLAEGISAVSLTGFNTLRGNVEAVSAVYNFQGGTIGSGTLTISVAAPIGSMLFDGAIDYVSITSTSSRLSFDTCRIMAIERSSQNQWPASKSLKDTVIYKNHGNNRGTEIKFIDAVNDPSFALVTCGVGMDEPSFDVTVVFTTNKGTRYSIPRALAVDSRVQVQYLETTSSSIGTSVRVTCNDEIAPDFSIDRLKTTIKQIKGFYPDSTNSKVGVFHLSLFSDNAFSASLVMPGTLVGLVQLMKSVDAQFTDATASPIAPVINEGEWRCGPYVSDVCATNACRPRFDNVGCYVGMTSVQKEQCRHLPYPVPNTDGCGVYKCRSRDGLGYVDCNDSEVCVEGCRDLEVPFFPALASSSRLSKPVCLRNGQQANAEVFCPLETVASPVFSTSCSPRSSCELKCKDSSGAIQSCEDESTWSDCSSTECGVTGTQERFFLCTDSSVTDGSNSSSIPSSLCDHIPTARTQECSPALCDGWRCAASNTDTFADCKLDSTWPNCPVSGCTKENKVSRVFKCFSKDNVEVSDENCTEDDPITSKNCPLVTDQCNPTFEGSQCNLDYMGEFDFSADPNCLPEGAENPYQRGSCVDSKNAVVNSTWCTPGSLLRQCSLPACGSDSPITYEWSSTPGPCIATDVRCATLRPKTVVCMAVQDGGRTVTDDSFCNQKRRPAKFEACDSDEGVSCGSSGVCDQSHPAQDANGDLVPGMTMGFCACNDEMHFGPSCDDIVAFTSVEVNGSVQDGFHLAWSLSKTISSMMVRVTVQPVDESTPAMTLGIFSANATKISGITVMDIQDLVPPGDTKFTFIINGVVGPSVSKVIAPKCESPFANCLNGGTCGDDGTCVCAGSFSGDRCSISACSSLGCDEKNSIECSFNEGDSSCTCIGDDDSLELFDDAKCVSPSVCVEKVQCKNGGHVIGDVNPSDYNVTSCGCSCLDNYSGDRCEACKFELPGFCVNGAPRKGCSGCACNKGFTGETCACRFIAATIPLKMNMFVDVTNKQSPATRLFFREVGLALQSAVTSDATIIIAAAKYKGTTSLHVTFVITLASCDSFLILGTAEDEKQALLLAVTRIKNAMLDGKLNQNLPAGSWISAEAKLTVDDDVPCEGPECSESGGSSLSTGAIIGIAVGCAVAGVFIAFIVLSCLCGWLCFSKGQTSSSSSQEVQMSATNQI